jgi:transcriptional regulator with XRE-family HTH domain
MNKEDGLPVIGEEISSPADFARQVRTRVFETQAEIASYLGIDRSTISKYESGKIIPQREYLAYILKGLGEQEEYIQVASNESSPEENSVDATRGAAVEAYKNSLVRWVNRLFSYFRGAYPGVKGFRSWAHLCEVADEYERQRLAEKLSTPNRDNVKRGDWDERDAAPWQELPAQNGHSSSDGWNPQRTSPMQATTLSTVDAPISPALVVGASAPGETQQPPTEYTSTEAVTEPLHVLGQGSSVQLREPRLLFYPPTEWARGTWHLLRKRTLNRRVLLVTFFIALVPLAIAATVTALPMLRAIVGESVGPGGVLDELWLDSRQDPEAEVTYYVRGSRPIPEGQKVLVTVRGTYSVWPWSWWVEAPVCKGKPDPQPMYPTAERGAIGINGPVGLDAEYTFAAPGWSRAYCDREEEPPYVALTTLQFGLTNDGQWLNLEPVSSGYSAEHTYTYLVEGKGYPLQARLEDYDPGNNYGRLHITVSVPR